MISTVLNDTLLLVDIVLLMAALFGKVSERNGMHTVKCTDIKEPAIGLCMGRGSRHVSNDMSLACEKKPEEADNEEQGQKLEKPTADSCRRPFCGCSGCPKPHCYIYWARTLSAVPNLTVYRFRGISGQEQARSSQLLQSLSWHVHHVLRLFKGIVGDRPRQAHTFSMYEGQPKSRLEQACN